MSAGEHELGEFGELERELASLRPARPSLGGEEVIGLRLNEELEAAFVEALRGLALPSPSPRLEAGLERDLAWEFRLEDRLRGLPLRRPTVALGRAVEVQVTLRALRQGEVVVPFPSRPTEEAASERAREGRGWGWLVRWVGAAALIVVGFGAGWKMAREAAQDLEGVVAGRFESEAARTTARMAVGAGWEPAGVPLPQGLDASGVLETDEPTRGVAPLGAESRSARVTAGTGRASRGAEVGGAAERASDGRSPARGAMVGVDGFEQGVVARSGGSGGESGAQDVQRAGGGEDLVSPLVVSGRLASRLASAQAAPLASNAPTAGAGFGVESGGQSVRSSSLVAPVAAVATVTAVTGAGAVQANAGVLRLDAVGQTVASPNRELAVGGTFPQASALSTGASYAAVSRDGAVDDGVGVRTRSRILDAVGEGDLARVIPVEILNAVESGAGLGDVRRLIDAHSLPVKASFSVEDSPLGIVESETISVHDLARLGQSGAANVGEERGEVGAGSSEAGEGFRQLVYVANDDELKLEMGKDAAGMLVARFERLDGHFLAADTVRSAEDLEILANRAKGVLGYLPSLNREISVGLPTLLMGPPTR